MTKVDCADVTVRHPSGLSISSRPLNAFPYLRHASTTRDFSVPGASQLHELLKVRLHLDAPASFLVYGEQKHTNHVEIVTPEIVEAHQSAGYRQLPETDALVCPLKNVTIAIQTADCAPIFYFDPKNQIIAVAHAGWKGTLSRVAFKTIETMTSLGTDPKNVVAWVGPMAGACCYEVGEDLVEKFQNEFSEIPPDVVASGRNLDLVEINYRQLEMAGLSPQNVLRCEVCTIHNNEQFYSYRADNGNTGRIISAMVMLEQ